MPSKRKPMEAIGVDAIFTTPKAEEAEQESDPADTRTTKATFQVREDQLDALHALRLRRRREKPKPSVSSLVRDAIDQYLEREKL